MKVVGSVLLCVSVAGEGAVLKKFTETGDESYARGGIFFLYFFAFVSCEFTYAILQFQGHRS